ncbi:MAG TPA: hypothetical protein VMZ53_15435 [Kofleriaceae bacterium]|nr:hypothetical protein [Kofleriaceae bacterium]
MIEAEPHLDETGKPCTRHAALSQDALLAYAAVGSRVSGFHHDAASKMQSLMMAIDEITELGNDDVRAAAATASTALRDLHQILTVNRALAKTPQRKSTPVRDLITRAAERHGVKVRGELPATTVHVALASVAHALSIALDIAAGPLQAARTVDVTCTPGTHLAVAMTATGELGAPPNANELLALASFLLRREDATLTCKPNGFVVELPLAQ